MNITQTAAYLTMTDANLTDLGLQGLTNNREVAKQFVAGAVIEHSGDGVTFTPTNDPAWDVNLTYRVQVSFSVTVATRFVASLTEAPVIGTIYYSPSVTDARKYLIFSWTGSESDALRLERRLIHPTAALAVAHAEALLSFVAA